MFPQKIAFVDIETTGLSITRDRIIEIGILRVENNQLTKTYKSLVNPGCYIAPTISQLTGITKESLEDAPTFSEIKDEIQEILDGCVFVAHNVRFDYGFIRNEFTRLGVPYTSKHFCTVKLSRQLFPHMPKHNLQSIIDRFNIPVKARHRAFDDAEVLWEFLKILQFQIPEKKLKEAVSLCLKNPSIPSALAIKTTTHLPQQSGVYIFYGENESPLYVGKSINIHDRVFSHFSADNRSTKEMQISQQIKKIEAITTAGELGALIKEAQLVKELQPLYNRQLRIHKKLIAIRSKKSKEEYFQTVIETIDAVTIDDIENILGIFKSRKQAQEFLISKIKEYNLCEKLLNVEKATAACFAYRLGICKGACIKIEDPLFYNLRFKQAFSESKIKSWPFNGPIMITEENELDNKRESFVIDKWCILRQVKGEDDIINDMQIDRYLFDLDTYKIILNYILNPKNRRRIRPFHDRDKECSRLMD